MMVAENTQAQEFWYHLRIKTEMQNRECDHENPLKEKQQIETTPTWETTPTKKYEDIT